MNFRGEATLLQMVVKIADDVIGIIAVLLILLEDGMYMNFHICCSIFVCINNIFYGRERAYARV